MATLLNFLPGLGAGYIYQRRWLPYFITGGTALAWLLAGIVIQRDGVDLTSLEQSIGVGGLLLISITTMAEAKLAHMKALDAVKKELKPKSFIKKQDFFGN